MVEDGAFSHKIDYVASGRASKSHYWFKSYGDFAELVDFSYWWRFSGEGSASAACAADLFFKCMRWGS